MEFTFSVFVTSIQKSISGVVVEAVNGGPEGPPFVRFEITDQPTIRNTTIGKRFDVSVTVGF